MKPHYSGELTRIRGFLERKMDGFPFGKCYKTSEIVAKIVPELDFVAGYFRFNGERVSDHGWNLDRQNGLIIDLTLDQFGGGNSPVTIIPADSDNFEQVFLLTLYNKARALVNSGEYREYVEGYKERFFGFPKNRLQASRS